MKLQPSAEAYRAGKNRNFFSFPTVVENLSPLLLLLLVLLLVLLLLLLPIASSITSLKAALEKATGGDKVDPSSASPPNQSDDSGGSGDATTPTAPQSGSDSMKVTTTSSAVAGTSVEGLSKVKGAAAGDGRVSERAVKSTDDGASEKGGGLGQGRGRSFEWSKGAALTSEMLLQARERLSETAASLMRAGGIENAVCFGVIGGGP